MWQNPSVIDKMYKKLVLQVSLDGLTYAVFDTLTQKTNKVETITFGILDRNLPVEDLFARAFSESEVLQETYDDITVVHTNNLSTLVPIPLFDEEYLGSYLQFNTKVFETDFFAFDTIEKYGMNTVYIPYVNINNFFIDRFGSFEYKHATTILIEKLLDYSRNNDERKMFVHVSDKNFEVVVIQNQKLELFNSFDYQTPEDLIYYLLFIAEQLHLNPEHFTLELLGKIDENSPLFTIAYRYIRNVSLYPVNMIFQPLTDVDKRAHFIILHA